MNPECNHPDGGVYCLKCAAVRDSEDGEWRALTEAEKLRNAMLHAMALYLVKDKDNLLFSDTDQLSAILNTRNEAGAEYQYKISIHRTKSETSL